MPVVLDRYRLHIEAVFYTFTRTPVQVLQGKQGRRCPLDVVAGQFFLPGFGPVFDEQESGKRFSNHAGVACLNDAAAIVIPGNPVLIDIEAGTLPDQCFKFPGSGVPALAGHALVTDM